MTDFRLFCDEEFPQENVTALENALQGFVQTDVPLGVEIVCVDGGEIQRLNREMRNIDKVTDVLSFPALDGIKGESIKGEDHPYEMDEDGVLTLGSIVICCDRAKEQAEEYGHSYNRELHYLIVHGIMHCLGYDHMTDEDKKEMREQEELILGKLGITRE